MEQENVGGIVFIAGAHPTPDGNSISSSLKQKAFSAQLHRPRNISQIMSFVGRHNGVSMRKKLEDSRAWWQLPLQWPLSPGRETSNGEGPMEGRAFQKGLHSWPSLCSASTPSFVARYRDFSNTAVLGTWGCQG